MHICIGQQRVYEYDLRSIYAREYISFLAVSNGKKGNDSCFFVLASSFSKKKKRDKKALTYISRLFKW